MITPNPERVARLAKRYDQHKFDHGSVVVVSGPATRTGAARLAAHAALRVGAGVVTLVAPPDAAGEIAAHIGAIMLKTFAKADLFSGLLKADRRINALCLGPGMGVNETSAQVVQAALESGRSCVLDADAITMLAQSEVLRSQIHMRCVLTPHRAEFERLFADARGTSPIDLVAKTDLTRQAAAQLGCIVVHKGAQTVIATPAGDAALLDLTGERAVPWLATAGSGDVLAGLVAGLLGRGLSPFEAAQTAALLHAEAGRLFGPGLTADDLPDMIRQVLLAWLPH